MNITQRQEPALPARRCTEGRRWRSCWCGGPVETQTPVAGAHPSDRLVARQPTRGGAPSSPPLTPEISIWTENFATAARMRPHCKFGSGCVASALKVRRFAEPESDPAIRPSSQTPTSQTPSSAHGWASEACGSDACGYSEASGSGQEGQSLGAEPGLHSCLAQCSLGSGAGGAEPGSDVDNREPELNEATLFVGDLAKEVNELDLRRAFSEHGQVLSVDIKRDRETRSSLGYGFVQYASHRCVRLRARPTRHG